MIKHLYIFSIKILKLKDKNNIIALGQLVYLKYVNIIPKLLIPLLWINCTKVFNLKKILK